VLSPTGFPRYTLPVAQAASSMIVTPRPRTAAEMAAMSAGRPTWSTTMIAFVRPVIAAGMRRGSMFRVSGSMSTNTGRAPQ
jgi:hypothetical protein